MHVRRVGGRVDLDVTECMRGRATHLSTFQLNLRYPFCHHLVTERTHTHILKENSG